MSKLYIPNDLNVNDISCVHINNDDSVYLTLNNGLNYELRYNNLINDYVLMPISTIDVDCQNIQLSNEYFYRKDFTSSLLIFTILSIFWFYIPYKIFTRAFGRWFKYD